MMRDNNAHDGSERTRDKAKDGGERMRDNNAHDGSERTRDKAKDGSERTRDKAKDGIERMRDNNAHDGSERTRGDGRKSLRHQEIEPRPFAWKAKMLTIRPMALWKLFTRRISGP